MSTVRYLYLSLFVLFLTACTKPYEEQKVLFDEVMLVHDEVMPKMQDIHELKQQLNEKMQQLQQDSSRMDTAMILQVFTKKQALEEADHVMMSWMREFADQMAPPGKDKYDGYLKKKGISHDAYMKFLETEKSKVEEVKVKMLSSIQDAQNLLQK